MKPKQARRQFERFLVARGLRLSGLMPEHGVAAMVAFFREVPAEGCESADGADMLLFQWGTYDWGAGAKFEFDIRRQFITGDGEDEDIWQLSLTFRLSPTEPLTRLGEGSTWCRTRGEIDAFQAFVVQSAAFHEVGRRGDAEVELRYECAG